MAKKKSLFSYARESVERWNKARIDARAESEARKRRVAEVREVASSWLEKKTGLALLSMKTQSIAESVRLSKTYYGNTRYVPEYRKEWWEPEGGGRVEYVEKQDSYDSYETIHVGYTNYLHIVLKRANEEDAGVSVELRGEVFLGSEIKFVGSIILDPLIKNNDPLTFSIRVYGRPADPSKAQKEVLDLLGKGWSLSDNCDFARQLKDRAWWYWDDSTIREYISVDSEKLKPTKGTALRILVRELDTEKWLLLLEKRAISTSWLGKGLWDANAPPDGWSVSQHLPTLVEWDAPRTPHETSDKTGPEPKENESLEWGLFTFGKNDKKDIGETLRQLAALYERGLLTDEEFHRAKSLALGLDNEQS